MKATGKVDESKVEEAKQEAETKASEPSAGTNAGQPAATTGSNGNSGSNAGGADKAPASQPASTPSASQPSGNGGSQGGTSQPEHVHNWVAQTEQQVTGYQTVVDQEAYTDPGYDSYQCKCGWSGTDISAHLHSVVASGGTPDGHNYSLVEHPGTYHPAVTHQEPIYGNVTVGYKCSGCGATK